MLEGIDAVKSSVGPFIRFLWCLDWLVLLIQPTDRSVSRTLLDEEEILEILEMWMFIEAKLSQYVRKGMFGENIDVTNTGYYKKVKILIDEGGRATQAKIRRETGIPKSSLSGITNNLVRKRIIKKREYGRTNLIELSGWFISGKEEN